MLIDEKTKSKLVYVGNAREEDMIADLIGDNWKELTGAKQPLYAADACPGYDHENYWSSIPHRWGVAETEEEELKEAFEQEKEERQAARYRPAQQPAVSTHRWQAVSTIAFIIFLAEVVEFGHSSTLEDNQFQGTLYSKEGFFQFFLLVIVVIGSLSFLWWQKQSLAQGVRLMQHGLFFQANERCITSSNFATAMNFVYKLNSKGASKSKSSKGKRA